MTKLIRLSKDLFINPDFISLILRKGNAIKILLKEPILEKEEIGEDGFPIYSQLHYFEFRGRKAELFMQHIKPIGLEINDSEYEDDDDEVNEEEKIEKLMDYEDDHKNYES